MRHFSFVLVQPSPIVPFPDISTASPNGTDVATSPTSLSADTSVPKARITGKGLGIAGGLWILYTLLLATIIAQAEDAPFAGALIGQTIESTIMALASIPVWWLVIHRMEELHWGWIFGAHFVMAPLYSWSTVEGFLAIIHMGAPPETIAALEARTPWLYLTHFTLYAIQFALYHLIRSLKRLRLKEQQATELLARAREQELAALKAQINPHFLFNTLNSISATLKRNPDEARDMISMLADMMRYALDSSTRDLVPLRREVDFVRRYLDLEAHRFSDRLNAEVVVEAHDDDLETPLPPMVLQPLVENALRHGIAPNEEGGTVRVHVKSNREYLTVHVEDTGVGPSSPDPLSVDSEGIGLANTSTRLEHTYGPDAALQTAPNDPTGFVVWFSLPREATPET